MRPDLGLALGMAVTVVLLLAVYALAAAVVALSGAPVGVMVAVVASLVLAQTFLSDRLLLAMMGARVVSAVEQPELHGMVEELAARAELPLPRVAVADSPVPNAFAAGRTRKRAVVCVTTGLMRTLDRRELRAVLAHELGHVRSRDVLLMTLASFFSAVALAVAGLLRISWKLFLLIAITALLFWAASWLLTLSLSRRREFYADRAAAEITGDPGALASALEKLAARIDLMAPRALDAAAPMNQFFIVPAKARPRRGRRRRFALLSTHPPLEERVRRLRELQAGSP